MVKILFSRSSGFFTGLLVLLDTLYRSSAAERNLKGLLGLELLLQVFWGQKTFSRKDLLGKLLKRFCAWKTFRTFLRLKDLFQGFCAWKPFSDLPVLEVLNRFSRPFTVLLGIEDHFQV